MKNTKKIKHEYKIGDKVLLQKPGISRKMSTPYSGPYEVQQVFSNGTIKYSGLKTNNDWPKFQSVNFVACGDVEVLNQ